MYYVAMTFKMFSPQIVAVFKNVESALQYVDLMVKENKGEYIILTALTNK